MLPDGECDLSTRGGCWMASDQSMPIRASVSRKAGNPDFGFLPFFCSFFVGRKHHAFQMLTTKSGRAMGN